MQKIKKLFLSFSILTILALSASNVNAARTDGFWDSVGTYLKTTSGLGYDLLINGVNKYINFNTISGISGYGFRDNSGTIQWKNSGGSWQDLGTGGGSGTTTIINATTTINGAQGPDLTFSTTSSGSDFSISTSSGNVFFNLPTASSIIRGALSFLDWNIFNNKVGTSTTNTLTNKTLNDLSNYIDADALHEVVYNNSGGNMATGTPAYSITWNVGQNAVEVGNARADTPSQMAAICLIEDALPNGGKGECRSAGILNGVNTNAWSEGTDLYVAPTGGLTSTRPSGATQLVQRVARVKRQSATAGIIDVFNMGITNDTPNAITAQTISVTTSTLGTVISGIWNGAAILNQYIASSSYWSSKADYLFGSNNFSGSGDITTTGTVSAGDIVSTGTTTLNNLSVSGLTNVPTHAGVDLQTMPTSNGDGTINVASNTGAFYTDATHLTLKKFNIAGSSSLYLVDGQTNYIYADYNNGSPLFRATTSNFFIDDLQQVSFGESYRSGNNAHVQVSSLRGNGEIEMNHERIESTQRYALESGLEPVTVDSNLRYTIPSGVAWAVNTRYIIGTSSQGTNTRSFFNYHSGGTWTYTSSTTPLINNQYYDSGTNLVPLTDNLFTVNAIYRGIESPDHAYVVLSNQEYDNADIAQASMSFNPLPDLIESHAMLVGYVIVQKGANTYRIINPNTTNGGAVSITNHNLLNDLQGGTANEYYHLTFADYSRVVASSSDWRTWRDFSSAATGLTYNNTNGQFSWSSGYEGLKTASATEWSNKVSSQWSSNANGIEYTGGQVGVGTSSQSDDMFVVQSNGSKIIFDTYDTDGTSVFHIGHSGTVSMTAGVDSGYWHGSPIDNAYVSSSSVWNNTTAQVNASSTLWGQALQWNGGSTNLVAATGRQSLGLGTMSQEASTTYLSTTSAASIYITQANASTSFLSFSYATNTFATINSLGGYVTFGYASSSYLNSVDTSILNVSKLSTSTSGYVLISQGDNAQWVSTSTLGFTSGGVTSLNGLTGGLNIVAGTNITISTTSNSITINSTAAGGAVIATGTFSFGTTTVTSTTTTIYTVPFTYNNGFNTLDVFVNGVKMTVPDDYSETSSTTITFVSGRKIGDKITFKVSAGQTPSANSTTTINGVNGPNFTFATGSDTNIKLNIATSSGTITFTPSWSGTLDNSRIASSGSWVTFNYASSTYETYAYASSSFPTFNYASSTYYFASNPSGYITAASLAPYLTTSTAASTYLSQTNASTSFVSFPYASSTFYLATNPSNYITAASLIPYLSTTSAASTYLTQANASTSFATTSHIQAISKGGTGTTTAPTIGQVLIGDGNGGYTFVASSTFGQAGAGEANTGANLGAGAGVFASKSGVTLQFKSLLSGSGISISSTSNDITITATGGAGASQWVTVGDDIYYASSTGGVAIGTTTNGGNVLQLFASTSQSTGLNTIGNINGFFQNNIKNTSNGSNASSDWVATADNGNDSINYVDFGINGSGGAAAPFSLADEGYVYSASTNMNIGALGSTSILKFYTTTSTAPNMELDARGYLRLNKNSAIFAGTSGLSTTSPAFLGLYLNGSTISSIFPAATNMATPTPTVIDMYDPPMFPCTTAANIQAVYSDDITRIITSSFAGGGSAYLRSSALGVSATAGGLGYSASGVAQTFTGATLTPGGTTQQLNGVITHEGYHYALAKNTSTSTLIIKRATSSWATNLASSTSWATTTVSGYDFGTTSSFILGAGNGSIWIGTSTSGIVYFTVSTSTNTLTYAGTMYFPSALIAYYTTRVNSTGLYIGYNSAPFERKYNFDGTPNLNQGMGHYGAQPQTSGPDFFATKNSIYGIVSGSTLTTMQASTRIIGW